MLTSVPSAFDFVVLEGIVLKQTHYAVRDSLELLSAGDILGLPLTGSRQLESRATSTYRAHGEVSLAVIEQPFRAAARQWPQLSRCTTAWRARPTARR